MAYALGWRGGHSVVINFARATKTQMYNNAKNAEKNLDTRSGFETRPSKSSETAVSFATFVVKKHSRRTIDASPIDHLIFC